MIRYQFEVASDIESLSSAARGSSSRRAFEVALRAGAAESLEGWSLEVRPRYGYPVSPALLIGGVRDAGPPVGVFEPAVLMLSVDAGYGFGDGSRLVVSGQRPFDPPVGSGDLGGAGGLHGVGLPSIHAAYERGW